MKLSVIVPVYNVECYVSECLNSIINQMPSSLDYEVVVVNDESPDNSLKIVNRIAETQSNIRVISQKNTGLGGARNTGLENAIGDFVWFVDSDDWIDKKSFEYLSEVLTSDIDAVVICAADMVNGVPKRRMSYKDGDCVFSGIERLATNWSPCVPLTIYRREFLLKNKLRMTPHLYHEDMEFTPRSYYFARKVKVLNEVLYYIRPNPTSITRSFNIQKQFDLIKVARTLHQFYVDNGAPKEYLWIYANIISLVLNNSFSSNKKMSKEHLAEYKKTIKENSFLLRYFRKSSMIKYRIQGVVFYLFGKNVLAGYNLLNLFYRLRGQ